MSNLFNDIISIFLEKRILVLTDWDIYHSLHAQGSQHSIEDIRRSAYALSPALFLLTLDKNNSMKINVDPQIDICQLFLMGRCRADITQCYKLHICRYMESCRNRQCHFPHDFTRGLNRKIVTQKNCQDINPRLLVKIIQLKKSLKENPSPIDNLHPTRTSLTTNKFDQQVDISFPSFKLAPQIDFEIIEMILRTKNIQIERKNNQMENEYFRRGTIQLTNIEDVEKLIDSPILHYDDIDIKIKRTKQIIDRTSFLLKIMINHEQQKVGESRLKLYLSLLLESTVACNITDISNNTAQILLIQANKILDFDVIHKKHQTKPQLQNNDVLIAQIYEYDTVVIRPKEENKLIKYCDVENIVEHIQKDIFTFQLTDKNYIEVEFINTNACKKWLLTSHKIEAQFHVFVTPIVQEVKDSQEDVDSVCSIEPPSSRSDSPFIEKPSRTTIILRPEWTIVAEHFTFQAEYKDYIRDTLGGEIEINGNEVTYTGTFPHLPRSPTNESIFANKTNNYMQKLKYHRFYNLKPHHVDILRKHRTIVAFTRLESNDYQVAAKPNDLFELKNKLFPQNTRDRQYDKTFPSSHSPENENVYPRMSTSISDLSQSKCERSPSNPTILTTSAYLISTSEQISIISINKFEDRLQQHLNNTYNVKTLFERNSNNDKIKGEKIRITIKLTGREPDVKSALDDVTNLFGSLHTRKFDNNKDGNWTKIDEATEVIQHHFTINGLLCACQKVSSTVVHVNFFHVTNPQFGVDEQEIEDLINNQFSLATIKYNSQSKSSKLKKELETLEDTILKRDDYKKDICLYKEADYIYLFGLTKLVKEIREPFEQLKNQYIPQPCQITLTKKQLNYLTNVVHDDLIKLEKRYKNDGCDLSSTRLRAQGDFLAPPDLHSTIKESLNALAQVKEITFEIKSTPFQLFISQQPEQLHSIVQSKCYLVTKINTHTINVFVPKSRSQEPEDSAQPTKKSTSSNQTSLTIGQSTIDVKIGDLTTLPVDIIVVCSTSEPLRNSIIAKAGPQVQLEFNQLNKTNNQIVPTSNGTLPCKKILFIPLDSQNSALKTSLYGFVSEAFKYAFDNGHTSLAFPSVGCGKLGHEPSEVARYMIRKTQEELQTNKSKMNVSFVILSSQQNVYDSFIKYLNNIKSTHSAETTTTTTASSISKTTDKLELPYQEKIVEITLVSSNDNHLIKCKEEIMTLSKDVTCTKQLNDKHHMIDWSQNAINQYYKYCLKHNVLPSFQIGSETIELVGPKDEINEAEKYYYELTTETYKEAHDQVVSRHVIWSFETSPNSDNWQQYSFKLNGNIEDAHRKKLPHIDIENDKQEKCRIVFSSMEEQHGTDTRRVRRKPIDSSLPDNWEPCDQNTKRVKLQTSSKEYQDVLAKFDVTMRGQYTQIIKIERIQNERWYKQYDAHREDHKKRHGTLDERLLFHGCPGPSADQIIEECFNRSFAGVNGIVYGSGVYFHEHARYSDSYAHPNHNNPNIRIGRAQIFAANPASGEKTMFLARVLIGKTIRGNQAMKVPPAGYDTTTDGQHIFVIYHDAGAYADHLITYN